MNNLAVEISRLIHNTCKDVPHDIGLQVMELVKGEEKPFNPELIPGFKKENDNWYQKESKKERWDL